MEGADYFVEGLLDFTNGGTDDMITDAFFQPTDANTHTHTPLSLSDSSNSSVSGSASASHPSFPDSHFSNDLCVPCDELEELEWLSNFVEESFSTEELHKFHLIPTQPTPIQYPNPNPNPNPTQQSPSAVPGKARSKRSRIPPCDWSTRLLMVSTQNPSPATSSSSGQSPSTGPKKPVKRRESGAGDEDGMEVRRCLHCAAEKTPQWRTGPMGPKTLCNACGVRYKSGRLVPEYRPAASPTFVSARHSNSHRKVMELRRQKEVQRPQPPQFIHHQLQQQQQQQQHHHQQQQHHHHHHHGMMMGVSSGGDEYLNYHHLAPDYRQMMS